ncbi:MAG TPA: archease [Candidatus Aenigmarchaeota archaeon]|nr:MAG: archease [Candidatus Aenigmarchaeota archaeon]HDD45967.1 archease [Candidatus Aenigmarchaeota archaeon]
MKEYKYLANIATADIAMEAYGKSIEEMFINAAKGMESLIVELEDVKDIVKKRVEVHATDMFALLYQWLEELLIYFDTEFLVFSKFNIKIKEIGKEYILYGTIGGQVVDNKMKIKHEVKAVTYHEMSIEKKDGRFVCRVLFDL